jgi:hypothetical protein
MIILELLVFTVGLVYFWFRADAKTEQGPEELPHLGIGSRLDPR